VNENKELSKNEESTKQFLILPLLSGLGYDVYNPKEVTPESTADFHKNKEKVDYAIYINGAAKIFVEAKSINIKIYKNAPQLSRSFSIFTRPFLENGWDASRVFYLFQFVGIWGASYCIADLWRGLV
jgi:hypothetical protein